MRGAAIPHSILWHVRASYVRMSTLFLLHRGIEHAFVEAQPPDDTLAHEWGGRREGGVLACRDPASRGLAAAPQGLRRYWIEGVTSSAGSGATARAAAAAQHTGQRRDALGCGSAMHGVAVAWRADCNYLFLSSVGDTKENSLSL
jgi:hypothetical protein